MLVSSKLDPAILQRWGIVALMNVGAFKVKQCAYLEFYRSKVFKR